MGSLIERLEPLGRGAAAFRRNRPAQLVTGLAFLVFVAFLPLVFSSFTLYRFELILLYAAAALGMYLAVQVSGEFMIGHVGIVGLAAFGASWCNIKLGWNPVVTVFPALAAGAITALLLGLPGLRLSTYYLGVISLFFVLILPTLSNVFSAQAGGDAGLPGLGQFGIGTGWSTGWVYEVILGALLVAMWFTHSIMRSTWGTRFYALRDAPQALAMAGVSERRTKVLAYLLSSVSASLAGWLIAYINGVVLAGFFGLSLTLVLLAAVIVGGKSGVVGTVIATFVFAGYSQFVGEFSQYNELGLGIVLLLVIIVAPAGITSLHFRRRKKAGRDPEVGAVPDTVAIEDVLSDLPPAPAIDLSAVPVTGEQPSRSDGSLLSVRGVSRSFGGNMALRDVSLEVRRGRVVGLVGANGSGKTTLINVVTGFIKPHGGVIQVGDRDVTGANPARVARAGVSRTFQVPRLIDDLTVRRNLEVGLLHRSPDSPLSLIGLQVGSSAARRAEAVDEIVALLGLDLVLLETPAAELSLGLKRVVEIGRAMAGGAEVLCLDEPAAGLNEEEMVRLAATLGQIKSSGRSVVLVEHHMNLVLEVCDDIAVLDQGEVLGWVPDVQDSELPDVLKRHIGVLT